MTVISQTTHKRNKRRSENPDWKRCQYCDTRKHVNNLVKDEESFYFCDDTEAEWYKEEVVGQ